MPRTLSSDSVTLHSMTYDQMDPEVRAQIISNAHIIHGESNSNSINIATCRGLDGTFMAFIVTRTGLHSALNNPSNLCSEPRHSRSAAMTSLLEATEDRIREVIQQISPKSMPKKYVPPMPNPSPKELPENSVVPVVDYSEKPAMKGGSFWKRHVSNTGFAPHV